jgi:hypothetical protein
MYNQVINIHNFYVLPTQFANKIRMDLRGDKMEKNEMGGACSSDGGWERRGQGLVGKSEGMRPLGRPRCRWEDNIKMDLQEVGCGGRDWAGSG